MQNERMSDGVMDGRLTSALEMRPAVAVPVGFAARVAGQVPVRRAIAVPSARYGLLAARIGLGALLLALVVVAMRSVGHSVFTTTTEWILCAEMVGIAVWLSGLWRPAH